MGGRRSRSYVTSGPSLGGALDPGLCLYQGIWKEISIELSNYLRFGIAVRDPGVHIKLDPGFHSEIMATGSC